MFSTLHCTSSWHCTLLHTNVLIIAQHAVERHVLDTALCKWCTRWSRVERLVLDKNLRLLSCLIYLAFYSSLPVWPICSSFWVIIDDTQKAVSVVMCDSSLLRIMPCITRAYMPFITIVIIFIMSILIINIIMVILKYTRQTCAIGFDLSWLQSAHGAGDYVYGHSFWCWALTVPMRHT